MAGQGKRLRADQQKRLRAEREQTLAELKCLRGYLGPGAGRVSDSSADSVDVAADIYEREKTLAIIQTLEKKLVSIERAMRATEEGTYGICEVCGEAIDPGRLEVVPHATTCVKCQTRMERLQPPRRPTALLREEE